VRFEQLAEVFEGIEATSKRLEMTDLLVKLLKDTPKDLVDKVVYLTQGKLCPDYMGIELGMAEKLVEKAISFASGRTEAEVESAFHRDGDLGLAAQEMLKKRSQSTLMKKQLTVEAVYRTFGRIARAAGDRSVDTKIKLLSSLLIDATPNEAKFVTRMALGKLRVGIADMTILDALAIAYAGGKEFRESFERAYNLSSDLGYVAKIVAARGIEGVKGFRISVGRPVRPMLCERLSSAHEILAKLGGKGSAEYKYDGLRIQAHVSKTNVQLFSRRLENITSQFPDVAESVRSAVLAGQAILEGECVAVDANTGDLLPFQVVSQRRGRKHEIETTAEEIPVTVFLFDVLYDDGQDFTLTPYLERRIELTKIVKESDQVRIAEQLMTEDPDELERYFDKAVSMGCEGLVVKSTGAESVYQAGARGWLWIKYKRSYKAEVADTFDLVPVGAFYGRGKRAGTYGALLMAVYKPETDQFETISKLGSGFTDVDLEKLHKTLGEDVVSHRHARVSSEMKADVWFTPTKVLEVSADEITLSPLHTCALGSVRRGSGLALRFPRFTGKYRDDKSPEDATTTKEALEIYHRQLKKIETEPLVGSNVKPKFGRP
jgi:DNA ligase-1